MPFEFVKLMDHADLSSSIESISEVQNDILFEDIQVCPIDDHSTMGVAESQVNNISTD